MIELDGFTFTGSIKLAWPIAAKIAALSQPSIEKRMLCGVTQFHTDYRKIPDPSKDEITHIVLSVTAIEPDVISVTGQFLATTIGENTLKKLNENPKLAQHARVFPNMYAVPGIDANGKPSIEKETVCTIDLLLDPKYL